VEPDQITSNQAADAPSAKGNKVKAPERIVIHGTAAVVRRDPNRAVFGVVTHDETGVRPYMITDERSRWWILILRPYFRRITIFQGLPVSSDDDARRLLEQTVAREKVEALPASFSLLATLRDSHDVVLDWDEQTGAFDLECAKP